MDAGVVVSLVSALVGGGVALAGVQLTNRGNTRRQELQLEHERHMRRDQLLRERGEELYGLLDAWLSGLFSHYLNLSFVMQDKFSYGEYFEQLSKVEKIDYARVLLLIDVYFPSVRPAYDAALQCRNRANEHSIAHRQAYDAGETDGRRFLRPYSEDHRKLEAAVEQLKEAVVANIRDI